MSQTKQQQSCLVPFIIMVVLMSLGGLITSLNQQFQSPMKAAFLLMGGGMKNILTSCITFSFFLAFLIMGAPKTFGRRPHTDGGNCRTRLCGLAES